MHTFKVGDRVIGNEGASRYEFTKNGQLCTVTGVANGLIDVKLSNAIYERRWEVIPEHFDLYTPKQGDMIEVCDNDGEWEWIDAEFVAMYKGAAVCRHVNPIPYCGSYHQWTNYRPLPTVPITIDGCEQTISADQYKRIKIIIDEV